MQTIELVVGFFIAFAVFVLVAVAVCAACDILIGLFYGEDRS